jgi:DNA-binding response OmpR family regulator
LQDHEPVNLLLTDIVMPGINGRELGKRAQAMRPGLPVLYMTGYSRNAIVHQGRLDEGVELLQKPVGQAQLAARIRALLDRGRALDD